MLYTSFYNLDIVVFSLVYITVVRPTFKCIYLNRCYTHNITVCYMNHNMILLYMEFLLTFFEIIYIKIGSVHGSNSRELRTGPYLN